MISDTELNLYKTLFRKKNLKEMVMFIPEYAQPITYLALSTDEILSEIVCMLAYIGQDVHLKEFKRFLTEEYKVYYKDDQNNILEKNYISSGSLNNKLKLLQFMSLIEIKEYRIRLTTQALSYYNDGYTKTDRAATMESKLERVTRAKLIAYTSTSNIENINIKELEDINIYRYTRGFVVLKNNDRETITRYLNKLEKIKRIVYSEIQDKLRHSSSEYIQQCRIDNPNFRYEDLEYKPLGLDDEVFEINLEESIYKNYKYDIDKVLETKNFFEQCGYIVSAKVKVIFNIKTF